MMLMLIHVMWFTEFYFTGVLNNIMKTSFDLL